MAEAKSRQKKTLHWHGCRKCLIPYDDNCVMPKVDGLCTGCSGGLAWTYLIESRAPKACCRESSRLATKSDRDVYSLAGTRIWYICTVCARTQPFDPKRAVR